MELPGQIFLTFVEEDNPQRGHFRVKPVYSLDAKSIVTADPLFPDDGFLRVVPDKNQQHTFKTRMRAQGKYCLLDLHNVPPEFSKIRTNKNYCVPKQESNRMIVYSDVLLPLPEDWFAEIIALGGDEELASALRRSDTKTAFIDKDGALYGPVTRDAASLPDEKAEISDDRIIAFSASNREYRAIVFPERLPRFTEIKTYPLPSAENPIAPVRAIPQTVMSKESPFVKPETAYQKPEAPFIKPEAAFVKQETPFAKPEAFFSKPEAVSAPREIPAAEAAPKFIRKEDEAIPVGRKLDILDKSQSFEEHLQSFDQPLSSGANLLSSDAPAPQQDYNEPAPKLSGTPLSRVTQPNIPMEKNHARNSLSAVVDQQWRSAKYEAPGASLTEDAVLRDVPNPVDAARSAMQTAWKLPQVQQQIVDMILTLPGMPARLDRQLHHSLSDTPAVLAMAQQLQSLEAERLELVVEIERMKNARDEQRKALLDEVGSDMAKKLRSLNAQIDNAKAALVKAKEAVREQEAKLPKSADSLISITGHDKSAKEIVQSLISWFSAFGMPLSFDGACAYLSSLFACSSLTLTAQSSPVAKSAAMLIAKAIGLNDTAVYSGGEIPEKVISLSSSPSPVIYLLSENEQFMRSSRLQYAINYTAASEQAKVDAPVFPLPFAGGRLADVPSLPEAVSLDSLLHEFGDSSERLTEVDNFLTVVSEALEPFVKVPETALENMKAFISSAGRVMNGGVAAAMDYALLGFLCPLISDNPQAQTVLKEYAVSMPRTAKTLQRI
ncbi:MAG: hypothetical protein PHI27_09195 [Eubacteriales bacterium]|nr:hypothetical protein [Eubacteriales bacterium]MDD3882416.1 hypothetical protein [Eubacteriales bacterium]